MGHRAAPAAPFPVGCARPLEIIQVGISMETRWLNSTNRQLPVIGQGTWYQHSDDHDSAVAALRLGIDLGMTHIDTAEMYLEGEAERWVGEAIEGRRHEVF